MLGESEGRASLVRMRVRKGNSKVNLAARAAGISVGRVRGGNSKVNLASGRERPRVIYGKFPI